MLQIFGYIVITAALAVLCFFCGRRWYLDIRTALKGGCGGGSGCSGCAGCAGCAGCSGGCASCSGARAHAQAKK